MAAEYVFSLCAGFPKIDLHEATGKRITIRLSNFHEVSLSLSVESAAAAVLWDILTNGLVAPTLEVWRFASDTTTIGTLVFNGTLAPFTEEYAEDGWLHLNFRSGLGRSLGYGPGAGMYLEAGASFADVEQTSIANTLISYLRDSWGGSSVVPGVISATSITRSFEWAPGTNVGRALLDLVALDDGIEFLERPVAGSGTSEIDVSGPGSAIAIGTDRPKVKWEYGSDTMSNVRSLARTISMPTNYVTAYGADGVTPGVAQDTTSISSWLNYALTVVYSDVSDTATLEALAASFLRPNTTRVIQIGPEPSLAPAPWTDFYVGDTGQFLARRGAMDDAGTVRVNEFTVAIDENGRESYAIPDPQLRDETSAIFSSVVAEMTD